MKAFNVVLYLITIVLMVSCQKTEKEDVKFIKSEYEYRHNAPFSDATEYDDFLFLTGQIGKDHITQKLVEGGIQAETRQVLTNIKDVLEANGSDLDHVLKCTVILSDINDFSEMNDVYKTYFPENKPARTTFGANLVGNAKIEIDVVAVKK